MNIVSFFHPQRTFLPCSGVGRHINNILPDLATRPAVDLQLLFSRQWIGADGKLPANCPLRDLPHATFPWPENRTERLWKLLGRPRMDRFIPAETDWIYSPVETLFPLRRHVQTAITIHDIHPFEPDLPWSKSRQNRWARFKWGRWMRRAIQQADVVFTVSQFSRQRMIDLLGATPEKIVNLSSGVEQAFFDAAIGPAGPPVPGVPERNPFVSMVGGLRHRKGGHHYLELAKELSRRESPLQIVIAGPNDADLAEAARAHPNIHLLGMVSDAHLPALLHQSLALVFLSLYEGFGIPPLEAMATGTPAIVANRASLPEVVGQAGIIVEPTDSVTIADHCHRLLTDTAHREQLQQRSRSHAAGYRWEKCTDTILQTLHERSRK